MTAERLPWESTPDEQAAHYRRSLILAGERRRLGFCVNPSCPSVVGQFGLTCGRPDCLDWMLDAPDENVEHWRRMEVVGNEPPEMLLGPEPVQPVAYRLTRTELLLSCLVAGIASSGVTLAVFAAGIVLGRR